MSLIYLTIWVTIYIIISSKNLKFNFYIYNVINLLTIILISAFLIKVKINFYIFFELSLIPTAFLIYGWGFQPERHSSSLYIIFYTISASIPLLISILSIDQKTFEISNSHFSLFQRVWLILAFLVKIPLFSFHLWLPKAHVEAPTIGSIILACSLLKLGGYGIWRFLKIFFFSFYNSFFSNFIISINIIGAILVGFTCMYQNDIKSLIAFSSITHIAVIISRIFFLSLLREEGALFIIISHGFTSAGLFFLIGTIYSKIHSRKINLRKGIRKSLLIYIWIFLLLALNIGVPPSINFLREFFISISHFFFNKITFFIIFFYLLLRGIYSMYIFYSLNNLNSETHKINYTTSIEIFILIIFIIPSIVLPLIIKIYFLN